jgi:tetratricopeptide (TPR) repeat protein
VSGNLIQEGLALANLGVVFHLRGDATGDLATYEEAAKWHREAIAVQQATGAREHLASRLGDLAQVELRLGRVADARVHLLDSMARLRALNSVRSLLYNVMFYAELLFAEGDRAGALDVLARALRSSAVDAETQRECDRIVARIEPTEAEGNALVAAGPEVDLVALIDEILAREG